MRYLDGVHRISSLPFRCHYGLLLIGLLLAAPVDRALGFDDRVSVGPAHEAPVKTTGIGSPLFLTEDDGYTSESPEMAPHTDGSFSVVWVDRRDGNQEIYYAKVSANGSVLIAARNISQSAAASTRPDVAVDGLGNAHICWLEGSSVVLSRVDAFGTEFLDNYVVSTGNCSWPAVAATGSGESWLGYRRTGLLQFYLYMAKVNAAGLRVCESVAAQNALYDYDNWTTLDWNTAGQTFMGFADVWNFQEFAAVQLWDGSCQLWAPFCGSRHRVFDSNEIAHTSISSGVMSAIYIVFSDNQGTGRKVYTMTACFAAALLSDTPGPSYDPQVATPEGTNCALVVWEDHSGPSGEIRLRIENRSEPSFSLSTSLTGNSTNPSLALVDCEHWAAVWQNDQGGQNEIVFMSTESAPPPPTGACCLPDGSCVIRTAEECAAQGGTYHGDGSACDPSPCLPAPTTGACCLADGSCITTTEQDCEAQGGCYQGDDVLCESVMCSASAAMPIGSPWPAGSTWQGGGRGSYYHQGYHGSLPGIQRSEFAIDFNLDSGNDRGYPILAAKEGDVVVSVPDDGGCPPGRGSFGNYVEIRHGTYQGESTTTLYTHLLEAPFVIEGEHILQGAVVGLCGATGCADGEHLHFEEREDGWSVPITSMDCYDWCDVPCGEPSSCCSHVLTSCNTALLDSAYARNGGVEMIGEPEYDMCTSEGVPDYHPWFWAWIRQICTGPTGRRGTASFST